MKIRIQHIRPALVCAAIAVLPGIVSAQIVPFAGGTYSQDFNGLPSALNEAISGAGNGPYGLDNTSWAVAQPAWTTSGMNGWQIFKTTGSSVAAFSINDGTSSTSYAFSYGSVGSTDRALGALAGAARVMAFGVVLQNTSPNAITEVTVNFTGEQWRLGRNTGTPAADTLSFGYKIGSGTDISGTFTGFSGLNFVTPVTVGTIGAMNGNAAANRVSLSSPLSLTWNPNDYLVLRWSDANEAGSDHGMAIDDFSLVGPAIVPEPSTGALLGLGALAIAMARRNRNQAA